MAWSKERNILQAFDTHGQIVSQKSYTWFARSGRFLESTPPLVLSFLKNLNLQA